MASIDTRSRAPVVPHGAPPEPTARAALARVLEQIAQDGKLKDFFTDAVSTLVGKPRGETPLLFGAFDKALQEAKSPEEAWQVRDATLSVVENLKRGGMIRNARRGMGEIVTALNQRANARLAILETEARERALPQTVKNAVAELTSDRLTAPATASNSLTGDTAHNTLHVTSGDGVYGT
jgi:hypothetical protein